MTMEVRELLSQVELDMSGHASGKFHPKETRAHGLGHTSAHQTRRFSLARGYIIPGEHPR